MKNEEIRSKVISELNKVIESLPIFIRIQLGKLHNSKTSGKNSSVIPIYTPMGNKR